MSFSTEFTGRSKNHALQLLDTQKHHLPGAVFEFIAVAINNIRPKAGYSEIVTVKAQGHLCTGPEFYEVSTADIQVRATFISD